MAELGEGIASGVSRSLREYLQRTSIQGAALVVVRDGEVVLTAADGLSSREDGTPMTSSTRFGAGSISKTFTALACLLLEKEGLLSIEDPVSKYLPGVDEAVSFVTPPVAGAATPLCVKHLLSHSSGIPELGYVVSLFFRLCGVEDQGPYSTGDASGLFSGILRAAKKRVGPPGARFMYSNENYVMLARIAEIASGEPFAGIVGKRILGPLGMGNSSIGMNGLLQGAPAITGYIPGASGPSPVPLAIPEAVYGPGGLLTTVEDLGRYLVFLLGKGKLGGLPASAYTTRQWQKLIARDEIAGLSYGLGWYVQDGEFDEALVYHGGDILYSGGVCAVLPRRGLGVAIGQNAAGSPALGALARDVLRQVAAETRDEEPMGAARLSGVYRSHDSVYSVEVAADRGVLKLMPRIPGATTSPALLFAATTSSPTMAEFVPAEFPPLPRRVGCAFVRDTEAGRIWLQYDNCLFHKTDPGQLT